MRVLYVNPLVRNPSTGLRLLDSLEALVPQHSYAHVTVSSAQDLDKFTALADAADIVVHELGFRPDYAWGFAAMMRRSGVIALVDGLPWMPRARAQSEHGPGALTVAEISGLLEAMSGAGFAPMRRSSREQCFERDAVLTWFLGAVASHATGVLEIAGQHVPWLQDSWALRVLSCALPRTPMQPRSVKAQTRASGRISLVHRRFKGLLTEDAHVCQMQANLQCIETPEQPDEWAQGVSSLRGSSLVIFAQEPRTFEENAVLAELQSSGTSCLALPRQPQRDDVLFGFDALESKTTHARAAAIAAHWIADSRAHSWLVSEYGVANAGVAPEAWARGVDELLRATAGHRVVAEFLVNVAPSVDGAPRGTLARATQLLNSMFSPASDA